MSTTQSSRLSHEMSVIPGGKPVLLICSGSQYHGPSATHFAANLEVARGVGWHAYSPLQAPSAAVSLRKSYSPNELQARLMRCAVNLKSRSCVANGRFVVCGDLLRWQIGRRSRRYALSHKSCQMDVKSHAKRSAMGVK